MKLLFLLVFTLFISTQTHADFVKTTHDFGNHVPNRKQVSAVFEFKNPGPSPAIITQTSSGDSNGRCVVSAYTKGPIKKNYIGRVFVNCTFTDVGFNQKQVATFNVTQVSGTTSQSLSVKAQVADMSECKPMDLNREQPLKNMPASDQDGMGICYAFTAAQAVEFQAKKNGINRSISAIDASLLAKENVDEDEYQLDSGQSEVAIRKILKEGIASRRCIDKVIKKHTQGTTLTSEEFLALVEDVWMAKRKKVSEATIKKQLQTKCDAYGINEEQFSDLLKALRKPFKDYIVDMFVECEAERKQLGNLKGLGLKLVVESGGSNAEVIATLDRILDRKNPPIISMCAEILKGKPQHRGLKMNSDRSVIMKDGKPDCATHSVLVTGRRKVNNQCEYLVRNSWGGNWSPKNMKCACKTPTAYYPDCSLNKEKGGNKVMVGCWVQEENLIPNTFKVIGF